METTKPTKFHEKIKIGSLGGGFVGFDCFVGFRDFRGFLDGGMDRYGAMVAERRKGRGGFFWLKRNAEARRSGRKTLRFFLERFSVSLFDFVGFRVFRGFLGGGDNRYGAKLAERRKGRCGFGGIEDF